MQCFPFFVPKNKKEGGKVQIALTNILYPLELSLLVAYNKIIEEVISMNAGAGIIMIVYLVIILLFLSIPILIIVLLVKLIQYVSKKNRE